MVNFGFHQTYSGPYTEQFHFSVATHNASQCFLFSHHTHTPCVTLLLVYSLCCWKLVQVVVKEACRRSARAFPSVSRLWAHSLLKKASAPPVSVTARIFTGICSPFWVNVL